MRYVAFWYCGKHNIEAKSKHLTRWGAYIKLARILRKARIGIDTYSGYVIDDKTGEVLIFMNR